MHTYRARRLSLLDSCMYNGIRLDGKATKVEGESMVEKTERIYARV